jgi:hypothetical protein
MVSTSVIDVAIKNSYKPSGRSVFMQSRRCILLLRNDFEVAQMTVTILADTLL